MDNTQKLIKKIQHTIADADPESIDPNRFISFMQNLTASMAFGIAKDKSVAYYNMLSIINGTLDVIQEKEEENNI